jgi:HIV Tat-specific factor 1
VDLAIQLLDDSELRPGKGPMIHVAKAEFQEKERPEPTEKKPQQGDRKKAQKKLQKLDKQLGWFEESTAAKAEKLQRIAIIKNAFSKEEIDADPTLILDLKEDVRSECEKLGEVTNVILYDVGERFRRVWDAAFSNELYVHPQQHPEGIISVRFKEPEPAVACVRLMEGRFFGGRRLGAELYDGKTRYDSFRSGKGQESEEEEKERLERYARWLEGGLEDDKPGSQKPTAPPTAPATSAPPKKDTTKVVMEREDENGELDPIEMDLTGVRSAGGVVDPEEEEDDAVEMPAGAVLLPGGGWALPPQIRDEPDIEKPTAPGMAWAAEDAENEALEMAEDDE